jgi:MarR-like DNA-binding transcriptional regulator SgrR of sgrS sRNA
VARALILLLLAGAAHAESRALYGGAVRVSLAAAPVSLDPLSGEPGDAELAALIYDTLFRMEGPKPRPHLALALDDGGGSLHARITLRGDVKLQDGSTLTAADVVASLERAIKAPGGWMLGPVTAARVVAPNVVELELSRPAPDLPLLLSTPAASVLPGGAPRPKPVGSGPFAVEKTEHGAVTLRAFADCFAGRAYLDSLTLRAFASRLDEAGAYETGSLSASRHGSTAFEGGTPRPATVVSDGTPGITVYLAIGPEVPRELMGPLSLALSAGLDRERLRRVVGAPSAAVPASSGPRPSMPAGARPRLSLLVDESRPPHRALADRLLAELSRLGVDASIELVEAPVHHWRRENGRYQLLIGDALPPAPDAGLAELALLAAIDPQAARAQLAKAPAAPGTVKLDGRLVPLVRRGARISHTALLRGVTVDGGGKVSWADVYLRMGAR